MSRIGNKAFTLIEVLTAVVILSVGIVGVIRCYLTLMNAVEAANFTADAAYLLKSKMADIEEKAIETPGLSEGMDSGVFADEYARFKWDTEIVKVKIAKIEPASSMQTTAMKQVQTTTGQATPTEKSKPEKILMKVHVTVMENNTKAGKGLSLWTYMSDYSEVNG